MNPAFPPIPCATGRWRKPDILVLLCTSVPSFMLQLDANVVSVSLPAIAHSLHASFAGIEWVVTAYILSFASLLMPAGAWADRYGRKPVLMIGLFVFTSASFGCGIASNLPAMLLARAIQGCGAAMQLSAALATLSNAFEGPARARAFAFWGSVVGIGIACGPIVGGLITQYIGWRWAFYINVPIGVLLLGLIFHVIGPYKDPNAIDLDWIGALIFAGALFLMTLALIDGNTRGWFSTYIFVEGIGALLLFAFFIFFESRQKRPMLDLRYFRQPTYIGAQIAQFAFSVGALAMLTFLPIFLQGGMGYAAGSAGLRMLPIVVPLFIVPPLVARHLAHRLSGRILLTAGLLLISVGLLLLVTTVSMWRYPPIAMGMVLIGMGAGILNGETTKVGMTVIPNDRSGMASGISATVRFTGLVTGIGGLGVILYGRAAVVVATFLPDALPSVQSAIVREVLTGGRISLLIPGHSAASIQILAHPILASSYQYLFFGGLVFLLISSALTWRLVRADETAPMPISAVS